MRGSAARGLPSTRRPRLDGRSTWRKGLTAAVVGPRVGHTIADRSRSALRAATGIGGEGVSTLPDDPPVSLCVVICTYTSDRLETLLAGLAAVGRQTDGVGDEVVVVVDHDDALAADLRTRLPPGTRVLPNAGTRGLSGARNTGWRAATAEVVVFLDDDAVLRPGSLGALRARMADRDVAVVGGAVHPSWEGGRSPSWFPDEFGWVVGCDYRGLPADGGSLRNPIGACMAVRREALEVVGGFVTGLGRVGTLPAGCEETLMGIQVHRRLPDARIVRDVRFAVDHLVPTPRQRASYFVRRCYHEGRSKAQLSLVVGRTSGLQSERRYVGTVLPSAVARCLLQALRGDIRALPRALAVVSGLAVTTAGLLSVRVRSAASPATDAVSGPSLETAGRVA